MVSASRPFLYLFNNTFSLPFLQDGGERSQPEVTETILDFTENISGVYGYLFLCVRACIENIVPPIPGDTVTIFGGYLTAIGKLNLSAVVLSTTIGSFAGFMLMFFLGKLLGRKFFLERDILIFPRRNFEKVTGWFEKFGYAVVLGNRFLSGARSIIALFAGITSLNAARVAAYGFVSCLVWNLLLVFAGYKVGENRTLVLEILKKYNVAVLCGILVLVLIYVIKKGFKELKKS